MQIMTCNHVALRCNDAQETIKFYSRLGFKFVIADRQETYRGKPCRFLHIFLKMLDGNYLAFFELPDFPPAQPDPVTPHFANHLAFSVASVEAVQKAIAILQDAGVAVEGPIVRPPFNSIYFTDPNGYRLEITHISLPMSGSYEENAERAQQVLDVWNADIKSAITA